MWRALWWRWLGFGWGGRLLSLALAIYGIGWVFGNLGAHAFARQLGEVGIFVLSLALTWFFIRLIWRDATAHHRR